MFIQSSLSLTYAPEYWRFLRNTCRLEEMQKIQLKRILASLGKGWDQQDYGHIRSYEEFQKHICVTNYRHWKPHLEELRRQADARVVRFEPTSGSIETVKWIPYTRGFLGEINQAASVWLFDLMLRYPRVAAGKHYWSLSWVPSDLRRSHNADDLQLFPRWQRHLLSQIMAVPADLQYTQSREALFFATAVLLGSAQDLTLISIWSPTFLLQLFSDFCKYQKEITTSLRDGEWALFKKELAAIELSPNKKQARIFEGLGDQVNADFIKALWPKLTVVSSWDSSTSAPWAEKLRSLLPPIGFQGKGLWTTEGVVTIPVARKKMLSYLTHFYEFVNLDSGTIVPSWRLRKGMMVQPIVTTSGGLVRYSIGDRMRVVDFHREIPCLEFLGRLNGTDLVGEKLDYQVAQQIITEVQLQFGCEPICFLALSKGKPRYVLLTRGLAAQRAQVSSYVEGRLMQYYHYQLARDLGQLEDAEALMVQSLEHTFSIIQQNQLMGRNKVEPIIHWDRSLDELK